MEEKKSTNTKPRIWIAGLICAVFMTVFCGLIYPLAMTGIAQLTMPRQVNGSLIYVEEDDGSVVCYGSELVGQEFTGPQYLIGRPDTGSAAASNLSAVSEEQAALVQERIDWWHELDPQNTADIPMELVTASGSGLDPHISPAAAEYQVPRIARERGMGEDEVRAVIAKHTDGKDFGFMGEDRVNVLMVNLELDGKKIIS